MDYFKKLGQHISNIEIYDNRGKPISLGEAIAISVKTIANLDKKENKIILIGNGGSASIASHIATDLLKNRNIPAITFNEPSLITCISNDLGYENVFAKPVGLLAKRKDILLAISSSGKSKNILNAVKIAKDKGCFLITMSGFERQNPLRRMGDINFYVPSSSYGFVEIIHLAICHCIADSLMGKNG